MWLYRRGQLIRIFASEIAGERNAKSRNHPQSFAAKQSFQQLKSFKEGEGQNMASTNHSSNYSTTRFVLSRRGTDSSLTIMINNRGANDRSLNLRVEDADTKEPLIAYTNGIPIDQTVLIPAGSVEALQIDLNETTSRIALEVSNPSSGGGMSVRQSSSSRGGQDSQQIELTLK
ncbi:hypothetical protein EN829_044550 [Mesorhizobium sp. M00.F.Ca.ET.186.01.1.1]|nr:hypothetical protein EN829_044550 [Mesorhizobium sp. M00.F.Ca.ET.186.01.1.1]